MPDKAELMGQAVLSRGKTRICLGLLLVAVSALFIVGRVFVDSNDLRAMRRLGLNGTTFNMSELDERRLTETMRLNRYGNVTIVTIANHGFRHFVLNWIASLQRNSNYTRFVVFAFDQALVDFLARHGHADRTILVPAAWLDFNLTAAFAASTEHAYELITQSKTNVWYQLAARHFAFLYSDPDVVFLSPDVLAHLAFSFRYSFAEVLFAQDQEAGVVHCNTGLFCARPTAFVRELFARLMRAQRANGVDSVDQLVLRRLFLATRFNDSRVDTLDPFLFASGQVAFGGRHELGWRVRPLTAHANYRWGMADKISALRSQNMWYV